MVDRVGRVQLPPQLVERLGIAGRARLHLTEDPLEIWPTKEASAERDERE
jgi:DNA-binding transcriptional regulator/RsmH inhibitor MraZ